MGLGTLLRAAAIIGACIWTIFLIRGWSAYSDMQAFRGGMYEKVISDAFQSLSIQSVVVFLLFLGGIFIKGSPTQEESSGADNNQSPSLNNSTNLTFSGDPVLENDSYKIFLTNKYSIQKNDALGKYILLEKLFDSIDEALKFAAASEESIKTNKDKEELLRKAKAQEEKEKEENYLKSPEHKKKRKLELIGAVVLFAIIAYFFISFNSGKSQQSKIITLPGNNQSLSLTCPNCGYGVAILVDDSGSLEGTRKAAELIMESQIWATLPQKNKIIRNFQGNDQKWRIAIGQFETPREAEAFADKVKKFGVNSSTLLLRVDKP
jgi:hypothetical protein